MTKNNIIYWRIHICTDAPRRLQDAPKTAQGNKQYFMNKKRKRRLQDVRKMFTRRRASAVSERAQRAKRTERSGSLPRFEIPGEFPFCKYGFCFLVLAWTFLALFYLSSLYALPVHARKGLCWEVFSSQVDTQDALNFERSIFQKTLKN